MKSIKEALAAIQIKLERNRDVLGKALRRHKKFRLRAEHNHEAQLAAERKADRYRERGDLVGADVEDRVAGRCEVRAVRSRTKAIYWKGRIRQQQRRIHHLEQSQAEKEKELQHWLHVHGVQIVGNSAVGGTDFQRWMAVEIASVNSCAEAHRRNAYSQSGYPDIDHPITPGPQPGHRDDCSSTITAWAKAAGLPDPNGKDFNGEGFTGTLLEGHNGWREVSLGHMLKAKKPAYIVYGSGEGHHAEGWCPSKTDVMRTAGHGSAPVDYGTVHQFGSGEVERYFIYDPKHKA